MCPAETWSRVTCVQVSCADCFKKVLFIYYTSLFEMCPSEEYSKMTCVEVSCVKYFEKVLFLKLKVSFLYVSCGGMNQNVVCSDMFCSLSWHVSFHMYSSLFICIHLFSYVFISFMCVDFCAYVLISVHMCSSLFEMWRTADSNRATFCLDFCCRFFWQVSFHVQIWGGYN